jgi:serine/threonine protein kinase/tetratricopeptide (TPR) repeat protein
VPDAEGLIDRTLLHYRVISHLGAGGMGEVYLALDTKLDREVALKVVPEKFASDPGRLARFEREAKSIAALNHPNIVTIHSIEEDQGVHFLTMELVQGKSLAEIVPRGGMPLAQVLTIAESLTSALAAAHERGIIHRDLKPANVMMTEDGRVKVLDFGLAKLVSDETLEETDVPTSQAPTATVTLTAAGIVVGTVPYLSPEYLDGKVADHRTDIFSLGVVLYEMVTGLLPFQGSSGPAVMSSILRDDPKPVSELNPEAPRALVSLIDRCLVKDPAERYQSATEVGRDLNALTSGSTSLPGLRPVSRWPRAHWPRVVGTLALMLLLGLLAAWIMRRADDGAEKANQAGGVAQPAFNASDWIIAVLPSRTRSAEDAELSVVNEGLALTLTTKLSQLSQSHALQVIPASMLLENEISTLEKAQQELGVSLALNFDTHRLGNRIRVNAQLVDVPNRRQITADTIDGDPNDLMALEEAVTTRVLRLLRVELKPMEESLLAAGTTDPEAYSFFVKGQGHMMEYHDLESIAAAAEMFEAALAIDPEFTQARAGLGQALLRNYEITDDLRWIDAALAQCTEAVELDDLDAAGHLCLGLIYNATGRHREAASELKAAKSLDPSRDLIYAGLARAYIAEGDLDLAEDTYKEAISIRPHYWAPYNWLGIFYHQRGRVDEALANFQEVIRLAPDSYLGYANAGASYYFKGDLEEAESNFKRALEIKPDYDLALSNLGTLYFFSGRYQEATDLFERAVAVNDKDFFNWGNLADAYRWGDGRADEAAAAYRKAIDLCDNQLRVNPNDAIVLADQAYFHAMVGAREDAIQAIGRALELLPSDIDVQHRGAQVFQALGEKKRAQELLEEALRNGYPQDEIDADPLFAGSFD